MHAASSDALTISLGCGCSVSSSEWKSIDWWWCNIARTSKLDWSGWFVLSEVGCCMRPFFYYYFPQVVDLARGVSFVSPLQVSWCDEKFFIPQWDSEEYPIHISDDWMWREEEAIRSRWVMGKLLYWNGTIAASRGPSHPNALYHIANQSRTAFQLSAN